MEKRVLVTGGMGFIGKYLTRKLISDTSYDVDIVDDLSSSIVDENIVSNPRVNFYMEDLRDWIPKGNNYHHIYHLASPVGPVGILRYKGIIGEIILNHVYKIARMAIKMDAKMLMASTSEVYGKHPENELKGQDESIELVIPPNINTRLEYAVAKALSEIVLKNLSGDNNLHYVCVRPFNIVGPTQNDDLGFVIPRFLRQALYGEPITVYGDGTQKRTFTHVSDIVSAMYTLMESDIENDVFNIGNPRNLMSILDLAKSIKFAIHSKSEVILVDPKALFGNNFAEAWNKIPNIDKIKSKAGWEPQVSLDDIIDEIVALQGSYLLAKEQGSICGIARK